MRRRIVGRRVTSRLAGAALVAAALAASPAEAQEAKEIRIAKQFGISYLPITVMEERKLLEKHLQAAGLGAIKVGWPQINAGAPMNDSLIGGNIEYASGGVGPLLTIWDRTRANLGVRAIAAINSMPLYLNTINPDVKTLKDFTEKDRIALPAVKVSIQAVTLQMAAEQAFGEGQQNRLDALTVTLSHPDGQTALLSGASEITAHFSAPPFQYQQLRNPAIHTVLNSYDVLGGPSTFNVVWTTSKFRNENPKLYDAFVKALDDATAQINRDKRAAAEAYLRISKDKDSVEDILAMLNDPAIVYTTTPQNVMKYVDFMSRIGAIKTKPDSWKDLFFPNAHSLPGG